MKRKILRWTLIVLAIGVLILFHFDPGRWNFYPPCPFYLLTNYYCPGCGSLRALHQLLHGNILKALRYNFLLLPVFSMAGGYSVLIRIFLPGKRNNRAASSPFLLYLCLFMTLLFGVLRNIPRQPFLQLAP
ncbi:MAG: DUF2752 domain-containing protein [Bacillota bacterium]